MKLTTSPPAATGRSSGTSWRSSSVLVSSLAGSASAGSAAEANRRRLPPIGGGPAGALRGGQITGPGIPDQRVHEADAGTWSGEWRTISSCGPPHIPGRPHWTSGSHSAGLHRRHRPAAPPPVRPAPPVDPRRAPRRGCGPLVSDSHLQGREPPPLRRRVETRSVDLRLATGPRPRLHLPPPRAQDTQEANPA